jgi:transposase
VRTAAPALASAYALAQDFAAMLRDRHGQCLDDWIAQVMADNRTELRAFATGLLPDKAAVEAGLTLSWSTGPCEGQIHKIKLIKRSMYGKAGFALLGHRVLAAA